jgi:autotransporter strand-loop-strand O-heptosyltransferase
MDTSKFIINQQMTWIPDIYLTPLGNRVLLTHLSGIKIDISGEIPATYFVRFIDDDTNTDVYSTTIALNSWANPFPTYFVNWKVEVFENNLLILEHRNDYKGKNVWIALLSHAIGDTFAWVPYFEEFRKRYECNVFASTGHNHLFASMYPEITFVESKNDVEYTDSNLYNYGFYVGAHDIGEYKNKNDWHTIPLQQVATDCLGLEYKEVKCQIHSEGTRPIEDCGYE